MSKSVNLQMIKEVYDAFGRGDLTSVMDRCTDDIDWELFIPPEIPYSGRYRGRDELARFFRLFGEAVDIIKFATTEFIVAEDAVVVLGWDKVLVKKTHRQFEMNWVHVYNLRAGRISRFREYFDTSSMVVAFQSI
jgi:ketosteroid isomerase-like protein